VYALNQVMTLTDNIEERCNLLQDLEGLLRDKPDKPVHAKQHSTRLKQVAKEMRSQIETIAAASTKQLRRGSRTARLEITRQMCSFVQTELAINRAQATADKWKKLRPLTLPKVAVAVGVGMTAVILAAKFLKVGEDPSRALSEGTKLAKEQEEAAARVKAAQDALQRAEEIEEANKERLERYKKRHPGLIR
jgi:hypothetical protein